MDTLEQYPMTSGTEHILVLFLPCELHLSVLDTGMPQSSALSTHAQDPVPLPGIVTSNTLDTRLNISSLDSHELQSNPMPTSSSQLT